MTSEGHIANTDGSPRAITSKEQNVWSHTQLRATHDAILVGVGTLINDNPRLDTRLDAHERGLHPYRIILDPTLRIPPDAQVVKDHQSDKTIVVHGPIVDHDIDLAVSHLRYEGVRVIEIPIVDGVFEWGLLWRSLITPTDEYHGLTSVLVEGGARTWEMFKNARMIDEEVTLQGIE